jgi:hypothetical protein
MNYNETPLSRTKSKQFFELPLATKAAVAHIPGPKPQRGWSAVYAERVGPSRLDNLERSGQVAIDELLDEKVTKSLF